MIDPLIDDRLIRIETALMHLENQYQGLHQALLSQQREIDALRALLERFAASLERDGGAASETRDLREEKPPHY